MHRAVYMSEVYTVYRDYVNEAHFALPVPLQGSPVWKLVWMSARLFLFSCSVSP